MIYTGNQMTLYDGRPTDTTGKEEKEIRVYDLLDSLGIKYQRTDHAPATTMEVCDVIDAVLDCLICKNLFLCNRQKTKFYLLMMPGHKPFKTRNCRSRSIPQDSPSHLRIRWRSSLTLSLDR